MLSFLKSQISHLTSQIRTWFAQVTAIQPGLPDDGLITYSEAPVGPLDKSWHDLSQEFADSLEAWRKNPIAKRLVATVTAFVLGGDAIRLESHYQTLNRFLSEFFHHPQNNLHLRQAEWCDELSRSGELFLILFTNPANGMSYVREMPASRICEIRFKPGDYEHELAYVEIGEHPTDEGTIWYSPRSPEAQAHPQSNQPDEIMPLMLHYAINRPIGALRGESDLAPMLPWLRRYSRWLEDRVRLNAALRAFLWIVKVPGSLVKAKAEQYRTPPQPGSVLVVDKDAEEWLPVTPALGASEAQADGRALRWMIAAGGPGSALTDFGEGEDSNLATATAMGEMRRRFLRRRQAQFGFIIADLAINAFNRAISLGLRRGRLATVADIDLLVPDITASDNTILASSASQMTNTMSGLIQILGPSEELYRLTLRSVLKFAGESLSESQFNKIITATMEAADAAEAAPPPQPEPTPQPAEEPSPLLDLQRWFQPNGQQ